MSWRPAYLVLAGLGAAALGLVALAGWITWRAWQATPEYQFRQARGLWEARLFRHYRFAASYEVNWGQCYYDIEVLDDRIVQMYGHSCLSSATSSTLTVDGIFAQFERFITRQVCSPNGCYCEGVFVVRATYHATWGYPESITTEFRRNWLDDLLNGKQGVRECRRTNPVIETIDNVTLTPLP
jgi:hypothetical protein